MPIKLTTQAYCKMLLHAAKYPQYAVNGLLVAERHKEKKKESQAGLWVLCVDCVPLFHGSLALAPMLEVALSLVRILYSIHNYSIKPKPCFMEIIMIMMMMQQQGCTYFCN